VSARADTPAPAPFIVGVARSGTTLLRLMLDAHPRLAIPPETHFLHQVLPLAGEGEPLRQKLFETVTGCFTWDDFGLDRQAWRRELAAVEPFDVAAGVRSFYRAYAGRHGKERWGDKTPTYLTLIADLARRLPEAHVVHLIRDGRAVAASRRPMSFGPGPSIEAQARDWRQKVTGAREQAAGCRHYLEVRYEDLVREPETTVRTVCRFLDLPFAAAMLDFHRRAGERLAEFRDWRGPDGQVLSRGRERIAIHANLSRPPDPSRVDAWRRRLSAAERSAFEGLAGDLLKELGYRRE
jgi:Sulfotransferase family